MVELTDFEKIFNAQTVKCSIDANTIAGTVVVQPKYNLPITRHNTRGTPVDTFASALDEIMITALVTDDLRVVLTTATTLSSRAVPPVVAVILTGSSVGGLEDISVSFNARIYNVNYDAPETGVYKVTFTARIKP